MVDLDAVEEHLSTLGPYRRQRTRLRLGLYLCTSRCLEDVRSADDAEVTDDSVDTDTDDGAEADDA